MGIEDTIESEGTAGFFRLLGRLALILEILRLRVFENHIDSAATSQTTGEAYIDLTGVFGLEINDSLPSTCYFGFVWRAKACNHWIKVSQDSSNLERL